MKTKNCVICLLPATSWTGHVLNGEKQITAGWCNFHLKTHAENWRLNIAPYGPYKEAYGTRPFFEQ